MGMKGHNPIRNARCHWWPRLLPFVLLLVTGCGSDLAEVQGTVSIDGQKVVGANDVRGTVLFAPREKGLPTGSGVLNETGQYSIFVGANEGLKPGPYAVAVTVTKIRPAATEGGTPSGQLLSPPKYANPRESGLEVDVEPGTNNFDLALESRSPAK